MTDDSTLELLRERAEAATPGGWKRGCWGDPFGVGSLEPGYGMVAVTAMGVDEADSASAIADAEFIAAADPTTIIALVDRVRELEGALRQIKNWGSPFDAHGTHSKRVRELVERVLGPGPVYVPVAAQEVE